MGINASVIGGSGGLSGDGTHILLIDVEDGISGGDLLQYDSTKSAFVPASFSNLDIISLVDVNAAIDAYALATADNGGEINLLLYATHVEVAALFDAYIPVIDYASVTNTPSLLSYATSVYVDQQISAVNVFSGRYVDLIDAPTLFSGNYFDLVDQPIIPNITDLASFAYVDQQVADVVQPVTDLSAHALISSVPTDVNELADTDGLLNTDLSAYSTITYVDQQLSNINVSGTDLSIYVTSSVLTDTLAPYALSTELFSSDYADLINTPLDLVTTSDLTSTLASVSFSGNYADLIDRPTTFSGNYADLINTPTLFSGRFDDLIDAPTLFSGNYADLIDQPLFPDISNLASITYVDTQVASVIQPGTDLSAYATSVYVDQQITAEIAAEIAALTLFSGRFDDLIDLPTLFSGSYSDLVDQPIIPNISDLASITYVDQQVASVIQPGTDLSAYALSADVDQQITAEITAEIAALTLFSGRFDDLINLPTIFSGNYVDLIDQPIIPDIADLSTFNYVDQQIATTFSGNFTDLVGVPNFSTVNYVDQQLVNVMNGSPIDLSSYVTDAELASAIAVPDITGDKNFTDDVEFRADIKQVATSATTTASKRNLVFAIETTDAVETEVSFSDNTYITLSDNTTAKFTATYVATTGVVHDSFTVSGIVHKMDGILVAIGNNSYEVTQDSSTGVTGAVSVDTVNDRMKVTVSGISDWVVFVDLTEVTR